MGGFGSGRSGRYVSIEGCQSYVLNAAFLNRARVGRGIAGKTKITYADGFEVEIRVHTGDGAELRIKHYLNDGGDDLIEYTVPLTWTTPRFGGLRWWFLCPSKWRRCCKLYLPNGGRRFLSRQAYRLRYACQVETRLARLQRQCRRSTARSAATGPTIGYRTGRRACGSGPTTGWRRRWSATRTRPMLSGTKAPSHSWPGSDGCHVSARLRHFGRCCLPLAYPRR